MHRILPFFFRSLPPTFPHGSTWLNRCTGTFFGAGAAPRQDHGPGSATTRPDLSGQEQGDKRCSLQV
ncbi:MAG: hypothetical protein HC884_10285 [Chloroflexaceae bacterium]|nr:hypothetical protein [Chloroflexaceae bacterium]